MRQFMAFPFTPPSLLHQPILCSKTLPQSLNTISINIRCSSLAASPMKLQKNELIHKSSQLALRKALDLPFPCASSPSHCSQPATQIECSAGILFATRGRRATKDLPSWKHSLHITLENCPHYGKTAMAFRLC